MTQQSHFWAYTPRKPDLKDTCTPMFIAALFIIARTWKQPRCLSADEWIRKLWYIYTMEYYSAIKKNSFESAFLLREFHGQRSLVSFSPQGCKESDTTDWLTFHFHFVFYTVINIKPKIYFVFLLAKYTLRNVPSTQHLLVLMLINILNVLRDM